MRKSMWQSVKKMSWGLISLVFVPAWAQPNPGYWQQQVNYTMEVQMDVATYRYTGTQKLVYTNHSPDTLNQVFYHLYFNAFQPGSEMDARLQSISDPDRRMTTEDKKSRIAGLSPDQIGYLNAKSLTQDGQGVSMAQEGTVLVVDLAQPLAPGQSTTLDMVFEGQVPEQIRRSGRNSREGVALSMAQWYPKMAEYDFEGWHATPYIAREFHGVWGDFDVKITLDKTYVVGGSGYLQNPDEVGHGYEAPGAKIAKNKSKNLTWHFIAPGVHDFMWAADPEYQHDTLAMDNGPVLHFLYKKNPETAENWKKLQPATAQAMSFYGALVGPYPYGQYSVIQGGDGGMEYAMSTLITGGRDYEGLVGVMAHEMAHSWFQHVLATNEGKHAWMDEGFTSFISDLFEDQFYEKNQVNPWSGAYRSYRYLVSSGKEQPGSTHADRYDYNMAYSINAYSKGTLYLSQLAYIMGWENLVATLQKYYADFQFKHPTPNDIKRTAEKVSGMHLDWFHIDWTSTTSTIDYGIQSVSDQNGRAEVVLQRIGRTPMPIDLVVTYTDGSQESFYMPVRMMYGAKENPFPQIPRKVLSDWAWAYPDYRIALEKSTAEIARIEIDPAGLMADVVLENNTWTPKP